MAPGTTRWSRIAPGRGRVRLSGSRSARGCGKVMSCKKLDGPCFWRGIALGETTGHGASDFCRIRITCYVR